MVEIEGDCSWFVSGRRQKPSHLFFPCQPEVASQEVWRDSTAVVKEA